jgi:hypothetical protein
MAAPARLPEGIVQPTVDALTLEALIEMYGDPKLRDQYFRHYALESTANTADTRNPTIGPTGERGGRGPMQVVGSTFTGLQNKGYIPQQFRWDNPLHSTVAGIRLFKENSENRNVSDPDSLSALYSSGSGAVKRGKDGKLYLDREFKNPKAFESVGRYLEKLHSQSVPERFSPEEVAERRRQIEAYLPHSYSTPYDYSLVEKVAQNQQRQRPAAAATAAKPAGLQEVIAAALRKAHEAKAAGDQAALDKIKQFMQNLSEKYGPKPAKEEEQQ